MKRRVLGNWIFEAFMFLSLTFVLPEVSACFLYKPILDGASLYRNEFYIDFWPLSFPLAGAPPGCQSGPWRPLSTRDNAGSFLLVSPNILTCLQQPSFTFGASPFLFPTKP